MPTCWWPLSFLIPLIPRSKKRNPRIRTGCREKGPRGLILAGPLSAEVLLFTPHGRRGAVREKGRHLLSKPGFVRAFSLRLPSSFRGIATSVDGLTGVRTSPMQRKRTPHFCRNAPARNVVGVQYGELECASRFQ